MFFDCRVYNKDGVLVRTHTAAELEERARATELVEFTSRNVSLIENFDQCDVEEYSVLFLGSDSRMNAEY